MALIVPLAAVPAQTLTCQLGGQNVGLALRQKAYGMYLDTYVAGTLILGGGACLNQTRIIRSTYLGFVGDLMFLDSQGTDDPYYTGLGTRWTLAWLSADDLEAFTTD